MNDILNFPDLDFTSHEDINKYVNMFDPQAYDEAGSKSIESANNLRNNLDRGTQNLIDIVATSEEEKQAARDNAKKVLTESFNRILEEKKERILKLWHTKTTITLKSLVDQVSPYAMTLSSDKVGSVFAAQLEKIDDFINYMLGVSGDPNSYANEQARKTGSAGWKAAAGLDNVLSGMSSDILDQLANDPSLMESVSQLTSIKILAETINTTMTAVEDVKGILKILEPLEPITDILIDSVMLWATGGATSERIGNTLLARLEYECQKVLVASIEKLKEFVFNIQISVPELMVGTFKSFDVADEFDLEGFSWDMVFDSDDDKSKFNKIIESALKGSGLPSDVIPFDADALNVINSDYSNYLPMLNDAYRKKHLSMRDAYRNGQEGGYENWFSKATSGLPYALEELYDTVNGEKSVITKVIKKTSKLILEGVMTQARKSSTSIPSREGPLWTANGNNDYYDDSIFEPDESDVSSVDKALLGNQISNIYFTESTIRQLSGKILKGTY